MQIGQVIKLQGTITDLEMDNGILWVRLSFNGRFNTVFMTAKAVRGCVTEPISEGVVV